MINCALSCTEERVEELVTELDEALRTKILSRSEGEKLRGRLQFASSQVFGRKFRLLLKGLSNHVTQGRKTLSQHTQACLCDIRKLLTHNAPRKIEASQSQAEVLHIYVDASFDYSDYSGLGGLIVDVSKKILSFFSSEVDERKLDEIMAKGQKTVIQELEMMAVLAAMGVWRKWIKACRVVLFTDGEAVRGCLPQELVSKRRQIIFQVEGDFDTPVWIERVPSQSNPSDILSRETVMEFEGAEKADVDPWEVWSLLTEVVYPGTSPAPKVSPWGIRGIPQKIKRITISLSISR